MGGLIPPISMTGNKYHMKIFEVTETKDYKKSHPDAFERGGADAWYNRKPDPHKYVPIKNSDGQKRVDLTDPEEIKAYHAGYDKHIEDYGPGGEKDY